ncbi:hypothetical protein [Pseudomonas cremoricolorata]|uniref:Uncharacterized protein n=1 Tax=Pseudomonas cremoricolorata TaxID=157783 RepID=A0A089WY78_9PSED|nr:hypothetical protein [Pseudomonas cremoricolorata]AIR91597.1 hypothetical protein LK03_21070 [Pseudomonas cremoricolorata]
MNKSMQATVSAEQARRNQRLTRAQRSAGRAVDAPSIGNDLLADQSDNTVKSAVLRDDDKALVIHIPGWSFAPPGMTDELTIFHTPASGVQEVLFTNTYDRDDAGSFPLAYTVDKDSIKSWGEGAHAFHYTVVTYNGSENDSLHLRLIFDRIAPYGANSPPRNFPVKFPDVADVTDANKNAVTVVLPDYPDKAAGDQVAWYWLESLPEDLTGLTPAGVTAVGTLPQNLAVPASVIDSGGDGGLTAFYVLIDKAGNSSLPSLPTAVGVALGALPANLQDPQVPLASDGLIDQADAWAGVTVEIPAFDHWKSTDQIQVTWGSHVLEWREIGSNAKFPLVFDLAPSLLWEQYGTASTGNVTTTVHYKVRRGTVAQGTKTIDIEVNLERLGPVGPNPDPEWPDPVNPRLALAEVYGKSTPTLKNELTDADENEPATLKVTVDAALKEGDTLSFHWADTPVSEADYVVKSGDLGNEIEREIPWSYIAVGNGNFKVHYTVARAGNPNSVHSPSTDVTVDANVLRPEAAEFLGANTSAPVGWLTCRALYADPVGPGDPAIRVQVPDLTEYGVAAGADLTMEWSAVHGFAGETAIPNASFSDSIKLDATTVKGFVWRVPYTDHVLPIYSFHPTDHDGRGRVTYRFDLNGKTIVSKQLEAIVSMHDASGSCPLRP